MKISVVNIRHRIRARGQKVFLYRAKKGIRSLKFPLIFQMNGKRGGKETLNYMGSAFESSNK